jgi:hypothetical protein
VRSAGRTRAPPRAARGGGGGARARAGGGGAAACIHASISFWLYHNKNLKLQQN